MAESGSVIIEGIAALLILYASLRAGVRTILLSWVKGMGPRAADPVRLDLGRTLSLALEFQVGADVLRTAFAPSWTDLGQLATIVAIRSLLNYFLERERPALEAEIAKAAAAA